MSLSIFINNHKLICKTHDRTGVAGPDILDNWLGIEPDYQSRLASVLTCQPRISLHLYPAASVASSPGRRRTPRQKIVTKMLPCSLCYHLDAISCCLISICYTVERFFLAIYVVLVIQAPENYTIIMMTFMKIKKCSHEHELTVDC